MKRRAPIDANGIFRPDDPMDEFDCDRLATALFGHLHRRNESIVIVVRDFNGRPILKINLIDMER